MFTPQDVEDERALEYTLGGLAKRLGEHPIAPFFSEMAVRCGDRAERIERLLEPQLENSSG